MIRRWFTAQCTVVSLAFVWRCMTPPPKPLWFLFPDFFTWCIFAIPAGYWYSLKGISTEGNCPRFMIRKFNHHNWNFMIPFCTQHANKIVFPDLQVDVVCAKCIVGKITHAPSIVHMDWFARTWSLLTLYGFTDSCILVLTNMIWLTRLDITTSLRFRQCAGGSNLTLPESTANSALYSYYCSSRMLY